MSFDFCVGACSASYLVVVTPGVKMSRTVVLFIPRGVNCAGFSQISRLSVFMAFDFCVGACSASFLVVVTPGVKMSRTVMPPMLGVVRPGVNCRSFSQIARQHLPAHSPRTHNHENEAKPYVRDFLLHLKRVGGRGVSLSNL